MKHTFTIPEASREAVQKIVAKNEKKARQYGVPLDVQFGEPYGKKIPVYSTDGLQTAKVDDMMVEVFDLTIDGEEIKKDGYSVIAKIEHLEGGNIVTTFNEDCRREWTTLKPHCDHCNGNHGQLVTFIVRHESGTEKQVGRTCLKDYSGIDPQGVGYANQLNEIMLGMDVQNYDFELHPVSSAYSIMDALALAVMLYRTKGYTKSGFSGSNKDMLGDLMIDRAKADQIDINRAEEIAAAVKAMTRDEAFDANLDNIKSMVDCGYCKRSHFGYIAYAPLAYERYLKDLADKAAWEAAKEAERATSQYIGEIGKRMVVDVADMMLLTSWENDWGYTYLYKIIDTKGNVLIWYASKAVDAAKKLRATIKDHNERDGVKQTIVTRCSVVA